MQLILNTDIGFTVRRLIIITYVGFTQVGSGSSGVLCFLLVY